MKIITPFVTALVSALCVTSASAAPKTAAQTVAENGAYFWVDGVYERAKLPRYSLGIHNAADLAPNVDLGATQSFNPRVDGGGVRAAIGYGIPGTGTRIEFGGSYIEANGAQSQTVTTGSAAVGLLMTGAGVNNGFSCGGGAGPTCFTAGTLGTDYRAWQFNGKAETDWQFGIVTVTPSVAAFGGKSHANQTLLQGFSQFFAGALANSASYTASTSLEWRDLGARAGLNLNAAVTPAFVVGIGGSVGVAAREVSFSGSDTATSTSPIVFVAGSSALSLSDRKTVLLANAEADVTWHLTPAASLRGFAGLNYDGDVPGIGGPSFAGGATAPTSRSAASIIYESETSFYAGGGLRVSFGGGRP